MKVQIEFDAADVIQKPILQSYTIDKSKLALECDYIRQLSNCFTHLFRSMLQQMEVMDNIK